MSEFFAVGLPEFHEACTLGLNPAVSLLVMACGTGSDNQTTAWSANAVQNYGGISWIRAKPAIDALIAAGIVQVVERKSNKPRYKLRISEERIWVPNSIIIPLAGEIPPVARIRQTQDVMLLRLLLDLYYSQFLAADGGLSRLIYYRQYEKKKYCEHGPYIFLAFEPALIGTNSGQAIVRTHLIEVSKTERQAGKNEAQEFFRRMGILYNLGLFEESAYLFESSDTDAEMLFPVDGPTEGEKAVLLHANAAAEVVLPDWRMQNNPHKYLVPVYRHQEKAEMFGIFRTRHRPHTSATSAWRARQQIQIDDAINFFKKMIAR